MIRHCLLSTLSLAFCFLFFASAGLGQSGNEEKASYVGSTTCESCHDTIYGNFTKSSKKAHSRKNVEKMLHKLTLKEQQGCYYCHTTGYGKKGGFVSYSQTPDLGDVGCETCHGPGSLHVESGDPQMIQRRPTIEQCNLCHNAERVQDFNFKPLIFSGAH